MATRFSAMPLPATPITPETRDPAPATASVIYIGRMKEAEDGGEVYETVPYCRCHATDADEGEGEI